MPYQYSIAVLLGLILSITQPALSATPPPMGDQVDFKGIINKVMEIYTPFMAKKGVKLHFEQLNSGHIVGIAKRNDFKNATLIIGNGYYTNKRVSEDGFRFVVCHELGHITGSAPHMLAPIEWDRHVDKNSDLLVSAEGQSDYFAANKCMPLMLAGQDHMAYIRKHGAPEAVIKKCDQAYPDKKRSALCQRIMVAGKNFLDSFAMPRPSFFKRKDRNKPNQTKLSGHPKAQCRLDTVVAGSLCPIGPNAPVDDYDPSVGFCTSKKFPKGARPRCWFKE